MILASPAVLHPTEAQRALAGFRLSCPALVRRNDQSGLTLPSDWQNIHARWAAFHTLRTFLSLAAVAAVAAALATRPATAGAAVLPTGEQHVRESLRDMERPN